ncbi:hypothetical protein [Pseudomonas saxonica]|uniref:Guanylate cyclase domain-containing protein n=1 Tax=Pseudomonas saxonica TaxID=2600598 RepID=A0A5C5PRG2_9PSED|nr:hypothetical protein [Pseudomonas saxonica]TWR82469.1 hypothetical protein FJD37_22010 [Pseudomonas saxonica]
MTNQAVLSEGRYLLFLDILGFSKLVETKSVQEVYGVIDESLKAFGYWERMNGLFKTIYFSDTFVFYQDPKGYANWAFLDIYAIGAMLLSALLAKGIPARGAISFGEFEVELDTTGRHQLYFGKALIEAYRAEQAEKWIGITVLPSAWMPYEQTNPGSVVSWEREGTWLKRGDNVLLLNPFIKLRGWYDLFLVGEIPTPYSLYDEPAFPNDILAFKFIREQAESYAAKNDFMSPAAVKYHVTLNFLRKVLGDDIYRWGEEASLPENF